VSCCSCAAPDGKAAKKEVDATVANLVAFVNYLPRGKRWRRTPMQKPSASNAGDPALRLA
jgi:hypothetical protein